MPFLAQLEKWSKITGSTLWGQKWPFWRGCSSAVCCSIELKIYMGALWVRMEPSHNFQLNRTAHGGGGASGNRPKSTFSKNGPGAKFFNFGPKVTIFGPKTKNSCLDFLVSLFWPFVCLFSNLFGLSYFSTQNRHFWELFSLGRCQPKMAIWWSGGHFLKVQTNFWKCTF